MTPRFLISCCLLVAIAGPATAFPKVSRPKEARIPEFTPIHAPAMAFVAIDNRMPRTKMTPAVYFPNLCTYRYRVGTQSEDCQKFVDQALGYFYSYVWIETARSAETAIMHDPECAFAWLILHKGIEKSNRGDATAALKKAQELMPKAPHREQMLITARLHERGLLGSTTLDERRKKAAQTLDELLSIYEDDEEAWYARGSLYGGFQGGPMEGVPFYKALLKVNPHHPGANHELVHFYEGSKRPALGWPHAEGYIASSPGIPHALHMQAHLAMRIGKWEKTTDRSARAIELEREYHRIQGVKPNEDHQYSHHLETLTLSLVHDGRFAEAREIRRIAEGHGYRFTLPWFRMSLAQRDWEAVESLIALQRKGDKNLASYMAALLHLEKGDTSKATAEVDVLRQAQQSRKGDRRVEQRLWEVQGRLQCATGAGAEGLKVLQRAVDRTKNEYGDHAWGGGAYYMEAWGIGALEAGNAEVAEEAFLEALAHDSGSVRAATGMESLCTRLGRMDEARKFAALADRRWSKAAHIDLAAMRSEMTRRAEHVPTATTGSAGSGPR